MKKHRKTAFEYYILLLSGFLTFLPLLLFDYFLPGSVDNHGVLAILWLIISFAGYLYALYRFVNTKKFAEYEESSKEREAEFYRKYKVRLQKTAKICMIADIPLIIVSVYALVNQLVFQNTITLIRFVPVVCVFYSIFLYVFIVLLKKNI